MAARMLRNLSGRALAWFESKSANIPVKPLPARFSRRACLALQDLEDRAVPATIMVTNNADSGSGSLRQAIDDLNVSVDATNDINFTLTTPATISLGSGLATIT